MRNVKREQLKKCFVKSFEEVSEDIKEIFGLKATINIDFDSIYVCNGENDDEYNINNYLKELSVYYDVVITSVHCDDYDLVGIWFSYL